MIRRLALSAVLAAAAFATPASAGTEVCPRPTVPAGACVHVVCLKLCVTEIEVDPYCSVPGLPSPAAEACADPDARFVPIGGG